MVQSHLLGYFSIYVKINRIRVNHSLVMTHQIPQIRKMNVHTQRHYVYLSVQEGIEERAQTTLSVIFEKHKNHSTDEFPTN